MTQQPGWGDPRFGDPAGHGQPPPYGQPQHAAMVPYQASAYGPPVYPAQPVVRTNGLAVTSLVLALVGIVILGGLLHILALIFGLIARRRIRETGENGDGLALAGILVSAIILGLGVLALLVWIVFFVILVGAAGVS